MKRHSNRIGAFIIAIIALTGCNNFAQPNDLEDLRVLAIRTEPAEILYSALYTAFEIDERPPFLQLPEYDVQVDVFTFDPRGGDEEVSAMFQVCPDGVNASCIDFDNAAYADARNYLDDDDTAEELTSFFAPNTNILEPADLDLDPSGQFGATRYDVRFPVSAIDAITRNTDGTAELLNVTPELPRFVFDVENPVHEDIGGERAFKRLPISLDLFDPSLPPENRGIIAAVLGVELCTTQPNVDDPKFEGLADCLFERRANENPFLVGFDIFDDYAEEDLDIPVDERTQVYEGTSAMLAPTALIRANSGGRIALRPIFKPGVREPYQVYTFDIDEQNIELANRIEDPIVSWHVTAGSVPSESSTLLFGTLDGVWTLPFFDDVAPDDWESGDPLPRATLFAVVRDQRGGVATAKITVEIREEGDEPRSEQTANPGFGG